MNNETPPHLSRRHFLAGSTAAFAFGLAQPVLRAAGAPRVSSGDKLNIAVVGCGGRGAEDLKGVSTENIVALCDCDARQAAWAFKTYPDAKKYSDWRKMLDEQGKNLDAVVVGTPDHNHAIVSVTAMRMGKHVYCEKPLARTIWEARLMAKTAAENKVVTQMGTQGHAFEGTRRAVEAIRAGAIGDIREVHVWTDRPGQLWPQGVPRPTGTPAVPKGLDWDVWLGPAPQRPYHPAYVPFKWRGFWDFGTGAFGDMGVHNFDTVFWALELGLPGTVQVRESSGVNDETGPAWAIIDLHFAARGGRGPVKMTWYDGGKLPPEELFHGEKRTTNGSLAVGSKGTLYTRDWHGGQNKDNMFRLLPRKQYLDYQQPGPTLPRAPGNDHHQEWVAACKGGPAGHISHFGYASVLTETLLLGNLALRTGKKIEWDAENMKAKGLPEADKYIKPQFREGWTI
jgi:predicted dehydrogenase